MSETVGLGTLTGGDLFIAVPESVGAAQPTVEVQIRDAGGDRAARGRTGEIFLRSPSVFLGYWDDPAATGGVRTTTAGTGPATSAGSPAACCTWRAGAAT